MQDGSFTEIAIPTPGSVPMGVWGSGTTVWFTEFQGNKIGKISVGAETSLSEVAIPTANAGPLSLSGGDLAGIWFTEANANKIGVLNQDTITEFSVPSANAGLSGIVTASGLAWFAERSANKVGSVTKDGRFTEYTVPTSASEPFGIARFALEGLLVFTERSGNAIARFQPDAVVVLAAQNVGGWTTEFDFSNVEDRPVTLFGSGSFSPGISDLRPPRPDLYLSIPPHGSVEGNASPITFGPLFGALFFRSLEDGTLPSVKARLVNSASPSKTIDIPTIRLSSVASLDPAVLVFPSALRTRGGGHSNLLIAEVGAGSYLRFPILQDVQVLVEGFSATGQSVGSLNATIPGGDSVYLVDVLAKLGVDELSGGSIRLTRVGGRGIMWGYLITVTDDGAIGVSLGATP